MQLVGELVNLRPSRARVYFELRDGDGAIPCAVWLTDWEVICGALAGGAPIDGMQVVVAGGCDFYPGSASASPGFWFSVATCASPARATCSPASSGCASSSPPRVC